MGWEVFRGDSGSLEYGVCGGYTGDLLPLFFFSTCVVSLVLASYVMFSPSPFNLCRFKLGAAREKAWVTNYFIDNVQANLQNPPFSFLLACLSIHEDIPFHTSIHVHQGLQPTGEYFSSTPNISCFIVGCSHTSVVSTPCLPTIYSILYWTRT